MVDVIDTGYIWTCPVCGRSYHLLHRQVKRKGRTKVLKHDYEEIPTTSEERRRNIREAKNGRLPRADLRL
ncbi:MAG: hypothetical protein HWN51_07610 [Desulfobacterales bacterium]|nr:hypothetical protein [Desulfobacterales bacterium]